MPMTPINVNGPAYETVLNQNAQRCINWYLEGDNTNGKFSSYLRPTPGLTVFSNITGGEVRGMIEHRDVLYAVVDNTLYSINSAGTAVSEGTLNSTVGTVRMAGSNAQIIMVDGTDGYIYDVTDDTFNEITDPDFPSSPDDVTYQDGYFIVIAGNDHKFYVSAISQGLSWNALDFASATADADYLVGCVSDHRELWLFGARTTEVWYNSGNATFTFERRPGVLLNQGLAARNSVTQSDNTLYWLAQNKAGGYVVVRASGYTPEVISSLAVSQAISNYTTVSDATAYSYKDGAHEFYVLTFPTENVTWVYDAVTNHWHERQSLVGQVYGRHLSNFYASAFGKDLVGDYTSGKIYELSNSTYTDNGTTIKRVRRTQHTHALDAYVSIYDLVLFVEPGIGLDSGQGVDPKIMMQVSKDGGHTFGNELWRSLGKAGIYDERVKWDQLGASKSWTFEFVVSDPVNVNILGAVATVEREDK